MSALKQLNSWKSIAGGLVQKWSHQSAKTKTPMKFSVFLPPQAVAGQKVPALYYLSGLTCNEDNFIQKAGALRAAAKEGLALICPDTSPRGLDLPGEHEKYDFGSGAGFYVNATQEPWSENYNMYDYITSELPELVKANFPVTDKMSVFGHSMGGHGALVCFLKNPGMYQSVSAFAPICNPMKCQWGEKCFGGYLGDNQADWEAYDATVLASKYKGPKPESILIDQGGADDFLKEQLLPANFVKAASNNGLKVDYREHDGYDHSYWFISTFIDDHIAHHAKALKA